MLKLFIHIGTHKTGTTTIQRALRNISKPVRKQEGWEYISPPDTVKKMMIAQQYDNALIDSFSKELNRKISKSSKKMPRKILSSEALSGSAIDGYMNSGIIAEMMRDITKNYDVKIVIYLRCQDDMAESMYAQKVHEGSSFEFRKFVSQLKLGASYNYSRMLKNWISCFGKENIIVKSYHTASQHGILKDFGKIIGSNEIQNSKSKRLNPSYSYEAIQIARIANASLDKPSRKVLRRFLQKTMAKQKEEKHSHFSFEDRKEFLKMYKDSNQEVADLFFNGDIGTLFPNVEKDKGDSALMNMNSIEYKNIVPLIIELLSLQNKSGITADFKKIVRSLKKRFN